MEKTLLETCIAQEEALQFDAFSPETALEIGNLIIKKAQIQKKEIAISITVNGYQVFAYGFAGSNSHNTMWLRRKTNTVNTVHKSTLHVHALLQETGEDLEKDWCLCQKDYAAFGGGFPIRLRGTGVIGSICVSGLPHEEDHQMVVDAITEYLAPKEVNYRREIVGLFGCPVDENPTVVIMEAAFRALGLNYIYNTTLVEPKDLETAVAGLRAFHMKGTNVTIPHKMAIIPYLDKLTDAAALIGAVNTVYFDGDTLMGENTDGKGFITSLQDANLEIPGKTAYILGAGGAARAIAVELALAGVSHITIANRSQEKAMDLVDLLNQKTKATAQYLPWDGTLEIPENVDFLINATPIGMYPDPNMPDISYESIAKTTVVCDVIANPIHTKFMAKAQSLGLQTLDGFSMLVNQGTIGFKLWTGKDAPVEVMRDALAKTST